MAAANDVEMDVVVQAAEGAEVPPEKKKGQRVKRLVWKGKLEHTQQNKGLARDDLKTGRMGCIVSRAGSEQSKARYAGSKFQMWNEACKKARASTGIEGFVALGKGEDGIRLLNATRVFYRLALQEAGVEPQG